MTKKKPSQNQQPSKKDRAREDQPLEIEKENVELDDEALEDAAGGAVDSARCTADPACG
jgi:hypothetical protein